MKNAKSKKVVRKGKAVRKSAKTIENVAATFEFVRGTYLEASRKQEPYDYNRGIRKLKSLRRRTLTLAIMAIRSNKKAALPKQYADHAKFAKQLTGVLKLNEQIENLIKEFH